MTSSASSTNPNSQNNHHAISAQLSTELQARHSLPVSQLWLDNLLNTIRTPLPPLQALTSTAHFRLLNSDFTHSLISHTTTNYNNHSIQQHQALLFPTNVGDVTIKSLVLPTNVPVQILSIQDVGTSKWSQVEAIERVERGEEVRGREVIRTVPGISDADDSSSSSLIDPGSGSTATATNTSTSASTTATAATVKRSNGPHKLLLQDAAGTKIYGFELGSVPKVFMTMSVEEGGLCVGAKMLIKKGTVVRRGMVMLTAEHAVVLGGKVEAWDKAWRSGRKERLVADLVAAAATTTTTMTMTEN